MKAGTEANRTGSMMERQIRGTLETIGFMFVPKQDALSALGKNIGAKWFSEQIVVDQNIYGNPYKTDFLLVCPTYPKGLQIESKYQDVGGSVDEKFPFTVATLKGLSTPSILVIDGGGARQCAVDWVKKNECDQLKIFQGINSFSSWARRALS